jgi:NTP pyrophosphatase (non-canonical NTP hydrolase)
VDGCLERNDIVNMNKYQAEAHTFAAYPRGVKSRDGQDLPLYPALGLAGEGGEFAEKVKKGWRDGTFDREGAKKELGDALWYIAMAARDLGFTLEEVANANLEKLESRQSRGVLGGSGDAR